MSTKTVITCDRCDKEIDPNVERYKKLKIKLDGYGDKLYDLCEGCARDYWDAPLFKKQEAKHRRQFNIGVDDV
jgi:hypothetical protein